MRSISAVDQLDDVRLDIAMLEDKLFARDAEIERLNAVVGGNQ